MCKPTSSTQLAAFLFVDSRWHELHDAVQCRARSSTFEILFEFQTEFFSSFLFEFQVIRASNRSTIEGPLYSYLYFIIPLDWRYQERNFMNGPSVVFYIVFFYWCVN